MSITRPRLDLPPARQPPPCYIGNVEVALAEGDEVTIARRRWANLGAQRKRRKHWRRPSRAHQRHSTCMSARELRGFVRRTTLISSKACARPAGMVEAALSSVSVAARSGPPVIYRRMSNAHAYVELPKLANDLFGKGLFQAGFGLNGEPARHLLGILEYIERIDFAPSHSNNMKTAVEV